MPQVMADMRHAFPSLRIDLDIRQRNRLTQWANRAACDCVFATLPHDASWSVQTPLFDAEYLIGMPRNHPLKDVRRVKVEDLIGHAFVNVRAGLTTRDKLQEMCAMHNTVPSISWRQAPSSPRYRWQAPAWDWPFAIRSPPTIMPAMQT